MNDNPVHSLLENKLIKDMGAERIRKEDLKIIIDEMAKYDKQLALACRFEFYCGDTDELVDIKISMPALIKLITVMSLLKCRIMPA
ncbi:MAG: hypothetical protein LBP85_01635 [Prevotellaceae bacterium]|nr:hypothetical protein [Prevotellaceae bacterium]